MSLDRPIATDRFGRPGWLAAAARLLVALGLTVGTAIRDLARTAAPAFDYGQALRKAMPAWGVDDNRAAYSQEGQLTPMLNNLRWVNDYFIKAHLSPNVLYGQVGNGGTVTFGFQASYSGPNAAPAPFTLNGTTCTST